MTTQVDYGTSTPIDVTQTTGTPIGGPLPGVIGIGQFASQKLAEFGLFVRGVDDALFNFVELNGIVGIATSELTTLPDIVLTVTRRLASAAPETEEVVYQSRQRLVVPLPLSLQVTQLPIIFTDGGIDEDIPEGYYAYALYVSTATPIELLSPPSVVGPVTLSGSSYIKEF